MALTASFAANTKEQIQFWDSKNSVLTERASKKILRIVKENFSVKAYRQIRLQVIPDASKHQPDHVIVYLFSKQFHKVDIAKITLDAYYHLASLVKDYKLTEEDLAFQPGISLLAVKCPDPAVEFIAFAPNNIVDEQESTKSVAEAAERHSLKTVRLLLDEATRTNYLNYMACPKLKGNFYDGDADAEIITTVDGVISYQDFETLLNRQFQYKVTNIWLACEAYNDPMKTTLIETAEAQKYAAGINDLVVGPSDDAAACAMKKALDGAPMTSSFFTCYRQYDTKEDQWGFGGRGSDYFTQ